MVRASGLFGAPLQLQTLTSLGLFLLMGAALVWSIARRKYVMLAGLAWFGLGTLPVIFLVHHSMEPYYIDFALPGLALAIGAACELAAEGLSTKIAVAIGMALLVALGIVGHAISDVEFAHEYGADVSETDQLIAQVQRNYRAHPSGAETIVVHSTLTRSEEQAVTSRGDLFRVVFHDSSLRVVIVP